MGFPQVTTREWRAQVEKELAGAPFEKALVHRTAEGIAVQPLYTEGPAGAQRVEPSAGPFRICMRAEPQEIAEQLEGGADGLWIRTGTLDQAAELARAKAISVVFDAADGGSTLVDPSGRKIPLVSTLAYHGAGADAADEIALTLASVAALLRRESETPKEASVAGASGSSHAIGAQVAVGRDTFVELAKLRALRVCWQKLHAAAGTNDASLVLHAVCSSRTLAQRDPWVNMLRVTTQVFAAVLGGADLVTPASFDQALGAPADLGRRVARNTGLVLREEGQLGKVQDPAGGSYYLETLTDALAREAWKRFQAIEREGGIGEAIASGRLREQLEAKWHERLDGITKRRIPVLGVSEFANLTEKLPRAPHAEADEPARRAGFPAHREGEPFEALRLRADVLATPPEVLLVTLGPLAESRPRAGFATNFFAAGGLRSRETTKDEAAAVACLCGSDEWYAAEAAARARALKAAGCARVLLAGRPGDLEPQLREAGVDGFVYVGCDAVGILSELLEVSR
ncbi:MAG TPA: methylmalonyl-CoA mutase family protein [Polyangiaceae bacterium]|jgi:methylmalonyl-CoA mutase